MAATLEISEWINQQRVSGIQILVLVLCAATAFLDGFDAQIIGYLAPAIMRDWHIAAREEFTPAFAFGLVGLLLGCLFIAPLADWIGRKKVMVGSVIAFGLLSFASASATSIGTLSILRFLTGVGLGGAMPNSIALTAEFFPARNRGAMTMVMFCGFPLGASFGGFLAAQLIGIWGWQSVFIVGGILPLILGLVLIAALPESMRYYVVKEFGIERVRAILHRINPRATIPLETRFVINEEKQPGLTVAHLFREGRAVGTLLLWVVFFMSLLDIFLLTSWLPTVLNDAGFSIKASVLVLSGLQFSGVAMSLIVGRAVDRFGCLAVLLPLYALAAIGIGALGSVGTDVGLIVVAACAAGAGIVAGQNTSNTLAAIYYPTYIRSTGVGWALGIGRIGAIVGPTIGGIMLSLHWDRAHIFMVGAAPAAIAAFAVLIMMFTERGKSSVRPEAAAAQAAPSPSR